MSDTTATPLASEERLPALDLVRGVAILGILPANMPFFCGPATAVTAHSATVADRVVSAGVLFLVSMKFVTLLSILFGVGLGLQYQRAEARGDAGFPWYYARRQLLLLLLGIAHALLLWFGDILSTYAVLAILALFVLMLGPAWVRWISLGGLAWTYLVSTGMLVVVTLYADALPDWQRTEAIRPLEDDLEPEPPLSLLFDKGPFFERLEAYFAAQNQVRIYRHGHFGHLLEHRLFFYLFSLLSLPFLFGWYLLACFLLGVQLFRKGLFTDPRSEQNGRRIFLWLGLALGVPCHVLAVAAFLLWPESTISEWFNILGALPLALLYLGLLLAWSGSKTLSWLQLRLRAVGRMALTNYLLQSVLCGLIFYGYGLGWYGRIHFAWTLPLIVFLWLVELLWSPLWLRHFRLGPVEWLWRSLAEGRPMRLAVSSDAEAERENAHRSSITSTTRKPTVNP